MAKKIIISYFSSVAAILQDNQIEKIVIINKNYQVNDIYVGLVQKIFSSINAAFINLGKHGKSGFIHLSDIKSLRRSNKLHHITDILSINQLILVQVIKEPTLNKGPRLTANIHLHGKYITLMPLCNVILISHQVYDKNERIYLYSLAVLVKPRSIGLLVKVSALGAPESVILKDLDLLLRQWYFIQKLVIVSPRACLVYKDEDLVKKVVRDFYDITVKKIIVDSSRILGLVYYYLKKWSHISLTSNTQLQLYNKQDSILDKFYITQTIESVLLPKVMLYYGGSIIIEHYEALTIVDVNSGSFNKPESSKETTLRINLYAAIEIAYQLRLRNINGVVLVDFIDMYFQRDQLKLLEHFSKLLLIDDAKPQIVQLSKLGLLELTRRRRAQSLQEVFSFIPSFSLEYLNLNTTSCLYLGFLLGIPYQYFRRKLWINKNISLLFFSRSFCNTKVLQSKNLIYSSYLNRKYFQYIDSRHPLNLFKPKANYIIPLVLYSKLTRYQKFGYDKLFFSRV